MERSDSLRLIALVAVACGGPRRPPVAPAPVEASPPPSSVAWDASARTVSCLRTNTSLAVPEAWRLDVVSDDEVELRATAGVAALVRSGVGDPAAEDVFRDLAEAHRIATGVLPTQIELRELAFDGGQASARYTTGDSDAVERRFVYRLVVRNHASCRIASVEPSPERADGGAAAALLAGVTDSAWLDTTAAGAAPHEDPAWSVLRGLMTMGVHLIR